MSKFTIDPDNNITALVEIPTCSDQGNVFSSEKELAQMVADWPLSRLVEAWNSFAGVAPFDALRPVKRFTSRQHAVARIWAAVQLLSRSVAPPARKTAPATKTRQKGPGKAKRRGGATQAASTSRVNKKAEVIAMLRRAKGATLAEIVTATGWQNHTIRGLVSTLASKGGLEVESAKNAFGERSYRILK